MPIALEVTYLPIYFTCFIKFGIMKGQTNQFKRRITHGKKIKKIIQLLNMLITIALIFRRYCIN